MRVAGDDVRPIDEPLDAMTICQHVYNVAERSRAGAGRRAGVLYQQLPAEWRCTVLQWAAKGLPVGNSDEEETYTLRDDMMRSLERLEWFFGMAMSIRRGRSYNPSRWTWTRR
jgi:rubredoxin